MIFVCLLGCAAAGGMVVGSEAERGKVATTCAPQPGATLVSVHQTTAGVLCQYASAPKRAKWVARAAT